MELTSTSLPSAFATSQTVARQDSTASITSDFETFLTMLTAQIENQDPLEPMDSTELSTQLATFSGVEQQVLTNELLVSLSDQMNTLGVSQLSGWVGMNAQAYMPVNFTGDPVTLVSDPSEIADTAQLIVRNTQGTEVARYEIGAGRQTLTWDGNDAAGTPLPIATYNVEVESYLSGQLVGTSPALVEGRVVEARSENGVAVLIMSGGQHVDTSDVISFLEPGET